MNFGLFGGQNLKMAYFLAVEKKKSGNFFSQVKLHWVGMFWAKNYQLLFFSLKHSVTLLCIFYDGFFLDVCDHLAEVQSLELPGVKHRSRSVPGNDLLLMLMEKVAALLQISFQFLVGRLSFLSHLNLISPIQSSTFYFRGAHYP